MDRFIVTYDDILDENLCKNAILMFDQDKDHVERFDQEMCGFSALNITDLVEKAQINIWNVVGQDFLYGLCGVIIALAIFNYLSKKNVISKKYLYFVLVLIGVQLVGDLTFATIIRAWPQKYSSKWINYS